MKEEFIIDASGKKLGRIATQIATILNGKNNTNYSANIAPSVLVIVKNASKLAISNKKSKEKIYKRYTGFFGGLRKRTLEDVVERKGYGEIIRKAVYGMLPVNRLRAVKLKNLNIEE